eukprot:m.26243 g.26243  ORF g.26243 m.26243 type:complete len:73 (+) comp38357_c0_seq2:42-260(+)
MAITSVVAVPLSSTRVSPCRLESSSLLFVHLIVLDLISLLSRFFVCFFVLSPVWLIFSDRLIDRPRSLLRNC